MVLVLSEREVSSVLGMPDGVRLIENAFRLHASGDAILVPRLSVDLPGNAGAFRVMAAVLPSTNAFGLKTLTGYPGRRSAGETYFVLLLFDGRDGALRAVMAANHITGIRTGAATGVAAKYLAREDAAVLGVFGAGVQARHQIAAIANVRAIRLVKICDIDTAKATTLAGTIEAEYDIAAVGAVSARETVAGSDIVVSATTSKAPVFDGDWLEEGTHVSGIGANSPAKRELDDGTFCRSKLVVDFRQQALEEAGDLRAAIESGAIGPDHVYAELGDIVVGRKPGRQSSTEITLFKSVGVAIEDIVTAAFVYEQAVEKKLGTQVAFDVSADEVDTRLRTSAAGVNASFKATRS